MNDNIKFIIENYEKSLNADSIIETQDKIRKFEKSLNSTLTEDEITKQLLELCIGVPLNPKIVNWGKNTNLFRARSLNSSNINDLKKWNKSDFGAVPSKNVLNYGRLNHTKESILYLSNDPIQTLNEIRYKDSEDVLVVISCFKIKKEFRSAFIGEPSKSIVNNENKYANIVENLYLDFFKKQFSNPVGKGTEYLYKLSNAIAKSFYDLPYAASQSWTYSAIENYKSLNVAFKAELASKFLEYNGSIIIKNKSENKVMIVLCTNSNYKPMRNNNKWIEKTFGLKMN